MKGKIIIELKEVSEEMLPEDCCGGSEVSTSVELDNVNGEARLMLAKIFIEDVLNLRGIDRTMLTVMLAGIVPWPGQSYKQEEHSKSVEIDSRVLELMRDYMNRKEEN